MIDIKPCFSGGREHLIDAALVLEQVPHFVVQRWFVKVDVSHLMISHGENFTRTRIKHFQTEFLFYCDPAAFSKNSIQMNRCVHVSDAVLGKNDYGHASALK